MDFKEKYNRKAWLSFLEDSFLPDDFSINEKEVSFSEKLEYAQAVTKLGESASLGLTVFEIKHKSTNDARVGLSKDAFRLVCNYTLHSRALVLFVPQNNDDFYRFSLVEFTPVVNDKGKVKRDYSNPRRYSFILGRDAKVKTPQQYLIEKGRVKDDADLKSRFSVEVLTKKFFSELFKWYDDYAMPLVKYPEGAGSVVKLTQENNNLHLIRLITRLIFVWFIKQKKLIPDWIFEKDKVDEVLLSFDPHSNKKGNYYNGILQNLFFATLNKAVTERKFTDDEESSKHYGIKTLYRDHTDTPLFAISKKEFIRKFEEVPFLNGGLFECLDQRNGGERQEYHDGFSRESKRSAFVPNSLFWGTKDGSQEGIIDLFNRYNFTIEENTPQDVDIALDPELLGKVFENLLGTFNPETHETARNESGSFYTPREIVDYMVDTSLKAYLKDKITKEKTIADIEIKLDNLFSYIETSHGFTESQVKTLVEAINNCKIIDPACGSGAFPMGILHKLTFILGKVDPDNQEWRELQRKKALREMDEALHIIDKTERERRLQEIDEVFESNANASDYGRKLYLLENCFFGVDIQPIAIQISKLRFFISLIVDQKTSGTKEDNYGILPLPNLETKFVAANTLIGVQKNDDAMALFENPDIEKLQDELLAIRHKHFSAKTAKQKISLREKDREVCTHLAKLLEEQHYYTNKDAIQMASWDPYNQNRYSEFFDPYWMFGIRDGFDVVIGNPPYVQLQNNGGFLANMYQNSGYTTFGRSGDIYQLFYERGLKLLCKNGHLCLITSNKWLRASYGETTRKYFANNVRPLQLIDFAGQRVFETATVDVCIILIQKTDANSQYQTNACIIKEDRLDNLTDYVRQSGTYISFPGDGK
ncbi:Eco57I restriction-modification methylase domain-containing protein, partial [Treponema primitia]|uniref:Eco57I restriction-modification methylase domain-containing protein n=1 Tax=Treponema primitia TaxID=88058 RepID=UPI0039814AEF